MKKKITVALLILGLICMQLPYYNLYAITNKPLQQSQRKNYIRILLKKFLKRITLFLVIKIAKQI